jgi:tRNA-uridine 2-sulfurtransferase
MDDKTPGKRGHAIALFSGGLDSALAVLLMLRQDIRVTALTFMTHFGCDLGDRSSCGSDPYPTAEKFGFQVKLMHLGQKFIDIVENPVFGRGAHMNPCIDCRILMLREAKTFMEMSGADFVVTGEVLGQRPFSQQRDKIFLTMRESGLKGKLLRPLSAKLLPPTEAELSGMVDREKLEAISGRSRKRQQELAEELGLEDYPNPGGGCLLTDAGYSNRLRDLLEHSPHLTFDDLNFLRVGRHFRIAPDCKVVIGRNEADNDRLLALRQEHHWFLEAPDVSSPLTVLLGTASDENLRKAAAMTARYSDARQSPKVRVLATRLSDNSVMELITAPADDSDLRDIIIH